MQSKPNRDPRRQYRVVDVFERELADYTGAPHAIAVSSCTNALFLALTYERMQGVEGPIRLPRRTYVGVLQSVLNAGFEVEWNDCEARWQEVGAARYTLSPTIVVDSARHFDQGMYSWRVETWPTLHGTHTCLSFHAAKQLPLGRGGAILTDSPEFDEWARAARMDGRAPGSSIVIFPGWHFPMAPDTAARGLDILSRWNDADYSPPPLQHTDYPDLSLLYQPSAI